MVVYASGTAKNPMSAAQMREKFFDCSAHAGVERPVAEKIAAALDQLGNQPSFGEFWPLIGRGRINPVIGLTVPLAEAAEAHRLLEDGKFIGKAILTMR